MKRHEKSCILRHDIDLSISKALRMADFEASRPVQIQSTYFVLLKTDFYNPASRNSLSMLRNIVSMGHEIGLHFDEAAYSDNMDYKALCLAVESEAKILESILGIPIRTVSMHRPSTRFLESNYEFTDLINAYDKVYFRDYKYISDSRRTWRENPIAAVESGEYRKLHILIHPFWYEFNEVSTQIILYKYIVSASEERRRSLADNIRDINNLLR